MAKLYTIAQARAASSAVREVREYLASGASGLEPDRAKKIWATGKMLKEKGLDRQIVADLTEGVYSGTLTQREAIETSIKLFGPKSRQAYEVYVNVLVHDEEKAQAERREVDPAVLERGNEDKSPDALARRTIEIAEEQVARFEDLVYLESTLDSVMNIRAQADALEIQMEETNNRIAGINQRIRDIKAEAEKANGRDIIALADEAKVLDEERSDLRGLLQELSNEFDALGGAELVINERKLETESRRALDALRVLDAMADDVVADMFNTPEEASVEADELIVMAEGRAALVQWIREESAKMSRRDREANMLVARRLEVEAVALEV